MNVKSLLIILLVSFESLASLSATTAKTIQGDRPLLITGSGQSSLAARSSFVVNSTTYKEFDGSYTSSTIFNGDLTLSDFTVLGLSITDFDDSYFSDANGDEADPTSPFIVPAAGFSYKWIDNQNNIIPDTDYNKSLLLLNSLYQFPLLLEITNQNVQVRSQYGDPNTSVEAMITKSYLINHEAGFYAIKPASLGKSCQWLEKINSSGAESEGWVCSSQSTAGQTGHIDAYGGGHSSDYLPDIGFKPEPSGNYFPTVGFPGAEFQLVMIGNQSDYEFSVESGSGVTVGSSNGIVTLNTQPTTVKIKAHHIASNTDFFYTFTISKWFKPQSGTYDYASAQAVCGGESNMISRSDFTNSPIASLPDGSNWSYVRNYGTRAIDGTLYSEWGYLYGQGTASGEKTYPNSNWQSNRYWTKDVNQNNSPNVNKNFFVHSYDGGYIGDEWADNTTLSVVCK